MGAAAEIEQETDEITEIKGGKTRQGGREKLQ